ncbi:hypothetical protein Leryth_023422 [Lithospermum erythrorhizon]|nr:hypothetical protein Leryth_023422 [Lithospermum erythrorhizon]
MENRDTNNKEAIPQGSPISQYKSGGLKMLLFVLGFLFEFGLSEFHAFLLLVMNLSCTMNSGWSMRHGNNGDGQRRW